MGEIVTQKGAKSACSLALVFAAVLSVSCGRIPTAQAQEHPFPVSSAFEAYFANYMQKPFPGAFALSVDGRYASYNYCMMAGPCNGSHRRYRHEMDAIANCQEGSSGMLCEIYAWRGEIVWSGPAPQSERNPLDATAPPIPPDGPSQPVTLIQCRLPDGYVISMKPERCRSVGGEEAE